LIPCALSGSGLRNQHHSEPGLALDHASVGIGSSFERKCLDHGADIFQDAEGESVLAINRGTCQASVNRTPSKDKRERIQLNLDLRNAPKDPLSTRCQAGHK